MKKKIAALAAALTLALALTGCSGGGQAAPVPEGMTDDTVLTAGQEVAELVLAQDYEGVYACFREDIRAGMTLETLTDFLSPVLAESGAAKSMTESATSGESDPEPHAIAWLMYDCEKRDLQLALAFDPELELIGIETELQRGSFKFSNIGKNLMNLFSK